NVDVAVRRNIHTSGFIEVASVPTGKVGDTIACDASVSIFVDRRSSTEGASRRRRQTTGYDGYQTRPRVDLADHARAGIGNDDVALRIHTQRACIAAECNGTRGPEASLGSG